MSFHLLGLLEFLSTMFYRFWSVCFALKKIILFIFGCAGSSLLCGLFSTCSERELLSISVRGLLIAVASLVVEHGL